MKLTPGVTNDNHRMTIKVFLKCRPLLAYVLTFFPSELVNVVQGLHYWLSRKFKRLQYFFSKYQGSKGEGLTSKESGVNFIKLFSL